MPPRGRPGLRGGGGAAAPHGQRGRGADGDTGDSDRLANIERQLLLLTQQAADAQAAPRGAAAGGGGRRAGGAPPVGPQASRLGMASGGASGTARPGDWRCGDCGAYPCWARTSRCFRCRAPRPAASRSAASGGGGGRPAGAAGASVASAGRGTYLGPRGANGSRPLLGRRDAAPPVPAMAGDRAVGGQATRVQPHGGGKQRPQRAEAPTANADGFQTVTKHVRPRVGDAPPSDGPTVAATASGTEVHTWPVSWAEMARRAAPTAATETLDLRDDDDDMDRGDSDDATRGDVQPGDRSDLDAEEFDEGAAEDDEYDDDDYAEDKADASEEALRRAWEEAKVACRRLERTEGMPHAVVDAARKHRDETEASWRAAKQPHPLHKRLRWAQRDLDAALAKQQAHQAEMERALEEMAQRRKFLEERAEADRLRTERRKRALQSLHDVGAHPPTTACEDAAKAAVVGIQSELGPTLCGLADKLECGSPAWLEIQTAMAALQQVQGLLQGACAEVEAERTTTSDQTSDDDQWRQRRQQQQQQQQQACGGPTCFDIGDDSGPKGQAAAAAASASANSLDGAGGAGKSIATAARWAGPARVAADKWGGPAWKKTRQANDDATTNYPVAAGSLPASAATGGGDAHAGSSAGAKEEAQRQLAAHKAQLAEAQAREKAAVEAARARQEQAAREHQLQLAQQQRAAADAAEAAETVRRAQEAVAKAEAEEARRLEREKQEAAARLSPEERRMAENLHAQQAAIAAAGFGTQQAAQGACMVHQAAAGPGGGGGDCVDDIMAMSPEQWHESLPVDSSAAGW